MSDIAISLDAPVDAPVVDAPIDTGISDTPEIDTQEPDEIDAPEPELAAGKAEDGPALANGQLSKPARQALQDLAKTQPQLAKEIKRALFESNGFRNAIPGGLKEVTALREQLEQFGGPEAIAQTKEELQYFNDLDKQFTSGDPRFLEALVENDEGKQGFLKLAPSMIEKFREMAPDVYASHVAKEQFTEMRDSGIDLALQRMYDFVNEPPTTPEGIAGWIAKMTAQYNVLAQYYLGKRESAGKKVDLPKFQTAAPASNDREAELTSNSLEAEFVKKEWTTEASGTAKSLIDSEIDRLGAARKLTDVQKAAVRELGVGRLKAALAKLPDFNKLASRHFANKDKDGYLRHVTAAYRQQVPLVFKAAADAIQTGKAVAKVAGAPAPAATPGRTPTGNGARPAEGYAWVGAAPKKETIDFAKTTGDMIRQGRAVLVSANPGAAGKRVQWKRD